MSTVAAFAGNWMGYLRTVSWQISLLIGIIFVIERLYTKSSPLFRYWLWFILLVRLLLPLNLIISSAIRLFPGYVGHMAYQAGEFYTSAANTIIDISIDRIMFEPAGQTLVTVILKIAAIGYCLGLLFFIVFIIAGFFKTRRFFSLCTPVTRLEILALFRKLTRELNITQKVELLSMDTDTAKITAYAGIFHPRIVISSRIIEEWPAEELEPILLHELYHVKRYDSVVNWLQIVLQSLHFFNPLVWYANNRLRMVREELCDDQVVRHLGNGHSRYARSMLRIMEETSLPNHPGFVMISLIGRENRIKERIGRIMKTDYTKYKSLSVRSILVLTVMVVLTVAIACEDSENLTPTKSPALKEITEKTESNAVKFEPSLKDHMIIKILENGDYEIDGTHTTPSNLENVLTEKNNHTGLLQISSTRSQSREYEFLIQALKNVGIADKSFNPRNNRTESIFNWNDEKSSEVKLNSITINILGNDYYEIKDKRISSSYLANALRNEIEKGYDGSVIIEGSDNTSTKDIDFVTDTAHRLGAKGIALTRELGKKMEAEEKIIIRERGDSKPAINEFESVSITILENGDYDIDGTQVTLSDLEKALTELKEKINHPKTVLQIKERKRDGETSPTPEYELLIKTLQKVGVDIEG